MNRYDARQQFIEGLEQYVAGIETDRRLLRLARNVCAYHDQMPAEAYRLVKFWQPATALPAVTRVRRWRSNSI